MKMRKASTGEGCFGCSCLGMIIILLINLTLGAYCFNYSLDSTIGRKESIPVAMLGGAVLGEITIPAAVVCWIVRDTGVHKPFFQVE
jgi:hypothetical protein